MIRPIFFRWCPGLLLLAGLGCAGTIPARAETLTLAECLRETAEHNPEIIQQQFVIERSFADRLTLRARALPIFTVGGIAGQLQEETVGERIPVINQATHQRQYVTTATTDSNSLIAIGTETLFQPLFDAAIPASFRRGTAQVLADEENLYAVATTELHAARTQFLQTLYDQESGEVLHNADTVLAANIRSQTQLASAGLVGRAALLSAQVQRANFNPGILGATGSYRTDLARLLQTMGREPAIHGGDALAGITLAGTLGETVPAFDPADAVRRALERRPDLRNLRALVRTYNEDVNIAKAGYYPLIRLYVNGEAIPGTNNVRSNTPNAVRALRPGQRHGNPPRRPGGLDNHRHRHGARCGPATRKSPGTSSPLASPRWNATFRRTSGPCAPGSTTPRAPSPPCAAAWTSPKIL